MFDIVLTSAERALLEALNALGVQYLIVGMGAALIEGAPGMKVLPLDRVIASKRAARRPKDTAQLPMLEAALAALQAHGRRETGP